MLQRFFPIALLVIGSTLPFTGKAGAADCGNCGNAGNSVVSFTTQPELIVRHPIVVLQPYNFPEIIACGNGSIVNQGQYHAAASLIPQLPCNRAPW